MPDDDLLDPRLTERRNPGTIDIDTADIGTIVDLLNAEDRLVPDAVARERDAIVRAIEIAVDCLEKEGRLIYLGAGTSGRLGVLDAAECPPTFGTDPDVVQGIIAGGYLALIRSQEGAEDRAEEAAAALDDRRVGSRDFVLGIATSGTTPFVRRGLERAAELGARTGLLCCTEPDPALRELVDVCIVPRVGPEAIAGSTRMKAGTATKLVLNTLSTAVMIRLGKVYENLMVDLQATSAKLVDRGERIVMALTESDREEAQKVIEEADGSVKVALVIKKAGVGPELARLLLAEAGGQVRDALRRAERARTAAGSDDPFVVHGDRPDDPATLELLLDTLRTLPSRIRDGVGSVDDERLSRRPQPDRWCAKEHIEHMIVFDRVVGGRIRSIYENEDPAISNWDETTENARIVESDARDSLIEALLRRLADGRAALIARVQGQAESDFDRSGLHERYGRITIYQQLRHLAWHDDHHLRAVGRLLSD